MYHQFTTSNSPSYHTMMSKLTQTIKHYEQIQKIERLSNYSQREWFQIYKEQQLSITLTLYNPKHNCYLFVLSNDKVLRYDLSEESFGEIKSKQSDSLRLISVEVLDIGQEEKYLVLTGDGIEVWSLERKMRNNIGDKTEENELKSQKMNIQLPVQEKAEKADQMQEQDPKAIKIQTKSPTSLKISIIYPKIQSMTFTNLMKQTKLSTKQQSQKLEDNTKRPRLRKAGVFIVKDLGLDIFRNEQDSQKGQQVFLVTIFLFATEKNQRLAIFKLRTLQVLSEQKDEQTLIMTPIILQSNCFSISLAMCTTQVPFNSQSQSQTINPVEITESNRKFTKSNYAISCDKHFVSVSPFLQCFSIYFTTQAVTFEMEAYEQRSFVFEYRIGVRKDNMLERSETYWGSPVFVYPEREVMCPAKVYYLPKMNVPGILCYVDVGKHFLLDGKKQENQSDNKNLSEPSSYSFNLVTAVQGTKVQFSQVECRSSITNIQEEQPNIQNNNSRFRNILNEENRKWHTILNEKNEKIVLRKVLLFDPVQKYAIILVNESAVKIRSELVKGGAKLRKPTRETKIVVVNLTDNLSPSTKRVSAEYCLQDTVGVLTPSVQLETVEEIMGRNFVNGSTLTIHTGLAVVENSLNRQKTFSIINVRRDVEDSNNQQEKQTPLYSKVNMIPKEKMYCQMLDSLVGKETQGMESFFTSVIHALTV